MTREEAIKIFNEVLIFGVTHCTQTEFKELAKMSIQALAQEPTKNDLGVDAVSRKAVHDMLENLPVTVEDKWFNWLQKACMRLAELPSVTPIRPKEHWIDTNVHHYYNDGDIETTELMCSCCNEVVEWDIELLHKPYFCENCGADMRGIEE